MLAVLALLKIWNDSHDTLYIKVSIGKNYKKNIYINFMKWLSWLSGLSAFPFKPLRLLLTNVSKSHLPFQGRLFSAKWIRLHPWKVQWYYQLRCSFSLCSLNSKRIRQPHLLYPSTLGLWVNSTASPERGGGPLAVGEWWRGSKRIFSAKWQNEAGESQNWRTSDSNKANEAEKPLNCTLHIAHCTLIFDSSRFQWCRVV